MADQQTNTGLIDEAAFPLRSALGQPLDYEALLNEDVLGLIGLKDASEEEKQALYAKMMETVENRVIARIADLLEDDEMAAAGKISDRDQLGQFFEKKGINVAKLFLEETLLYKTELVSLVNRDHSS